MDYRRPAAVLILGIESTCDETGAAVVRDGRQILSNVVASQSAIHSPFGGVVPELASRHHLKLIEPVIKQALKEANVSLEEIDALAVAHTPGLLGALLVGINMAKGLALSLNKPLIPVNHVEAHLYACAMQENVTLQLPALGLVVSGGHTALLRIDDIGVYTLLGQTCDDALGEAFDKVASLLDLPYPGGPSIERLAEKGDAMRYPLKAGQVRGQPLSFSFSGLKTGVFYLMQREGEALVAEDLAASFQRVSIEDVVKKSCLAAQVFPCRSMVVGGGVANNKTLRQKLSDALPAMAILWPPSGLALDNAAMIAGLAYHKREAPLEEVVAKARASWTEESVCK